MSMAVALEKIAMTTAGLLARRAGEVAVGGGVGGASMYAAGRASGHEGSELRNDTLGGVLGGGALGAIGAAGARTLAERRFRDPTAYRRTLNDEVVAGAKRFLEAQDARAAEIRAQAVLPAQREERLRSLVGRIEGHVDRKESALRVWNRLVHGPNVKPGSSIPDIPVEFRRADPRAPLRGFRTAPREPFMQEGPDLVTDVGQDAVIEALRDELRGKGNYVNRTSQDLRIVREALDPARARLQEATRINQRARQALGQRLAALESERANASRFLSDPGLALSKKMGLPPEILEPMQARARAAEAEDAVQARQRAQATFFGLGGR
jgi:hypothetical protein